MKGRPGDHATATLSPLPAARPLGQSCFLLDAAPPPLSLSPFYRILVKSRSHLLPATFLKVQFLLLLYIFGLASACFPLLAHARQQSVHMCFWAHMYICVHEPVRTGTRGGTWDPSHLSWPPRGL